MSDHVHRRADDEEEEVVEAPPGMTQAQLDFFTYAAHRTATKAARTAAQHVQRRALGGFLILLAGLMLVLWLSAHDSTDSRAAIVKSGRVVSVSGCNRDFNTQTALRGVLISSDQFSRQALETGRITAEEYQIRREFYNQQLANLVLPDCRDSEKVVTDDPRDIQSIPDPLYPEKLSEDKKPSEGKSG